MKKIYATIILLAIAGFTFAQTKKAGWLLGGSIQYSSVNTTEYGEKSNTSLFTLNPKIGYFPVNNFAVILNMNYQSYSSEGFSDHSLIIGPAVRYYFPAAESLKFFAGAGVGFQSGVGTSAAIYQFEAGPAIFITPSVAMELNIGYQTANYKSSSQSGESVKQSQFGVGLGFMVYLGKK